MITTVTIRATEHEPTSSQVILQHLNLIGDAADSIAKAYEMEMNRGYKPFAPWLAGTCSRSSRGAWDSTGTTWALWRRWEALLSRRPVRVRISAAGHTKVTRRSRPFGRHQVESGSARLVTEFFFGCAGYGMDTVAASVRSCATEIRLRRRESHKVSQRGTVPFNTPAIQTNFSPAGLAFWKNVHLEMATVMQEADDRPIYAVW